MSELNETNETALLTEADIEQAVGQLIPAVKDKLGIAIKKARITEYSEKQGPNYITADLLAFSRADAKLLNGEGGAELLAEISELLADILRDRLNDNAMVGCVSELYSFEDIYRARMYSAFDTSAAAERLCVECAGNPLIQAMSIENAAALVEFSSAEEMNAFREDGAEKLNSEIVRRLMKADKHGFIRETELRVILSVR